MYSKRELESKDCLYLTSIQSWFARISNDIDFMQSIASVAYSLNKTLLVSVVLVR